MNKQRKEETELISLRITKTLLRMIDECADSLRSSMMGANIGRADAVRYLIIKGLSNETKK